MDYGIKGRFKDKLDKTENRTQVTAVVWLNAREEIQHDTLLKLFERCLRGAEH